MALQSDPSSQPTLRPHFHVYFTVSYGMSRDQLEETNFLIKSSDPLPYHKSNAVRDLNTFSCPVYSTIVIHASQPMVSHTLSLCSLVSNLQLLSYEIHGLQSCMVRDLPKPLRARLVVFLQ